ncbi:MAG: cupin domain-containing protein [Pseudomonadota bacterium]
MQLHADFEETVWYPGAARGGRTWIPSPLPGVERLMLDRDGDEVAVATSLVRYAPEATFTPHSHALGEEYMVLEGEFGDEHGRYPKGTYVRNPAGTAHSPFATAGCVIWVKLRQFHPDDQTQFSVQPDLTPLAEGQDQQDLHSYTAPESEVGELTERVAILRGAPGERIVMPADYNLQEVFVLHGCVSWQWEETIELERWGWLRLASGEPLRLTVLEPAVLLWKTRPQYTAGRE